MPSLTFVRHGQSIYNFENRFTGNLDVPLTALGREEASLAGKKLKGFRYSIAYTFMLSGAWETLSISLTEINQPFIPVIKEAALNECMYGSLQGLNKAETAVKYGDIQVEVWRRSYDIRPPEGESLEDTYNRTVPYYRAEIEPDAKEGNNILIVAHGNSLLALIMYLENMTVMVASMAMPILANHVYVIPTDADLLIENYSFKVIAPRSVGHKQIDVFFISLAEVMGVRAIALSFLDMMAMVLKAVSTLKQMGGKHLLRTCLPKLTSCLLAHRLPAVLILLCLLIKFQIN